MTHFFLNTYFMVYYNKALKNKQGAGNEVVKPFRFIAKKLFQRKNEQEGGVAFGYYDFRL